MKTDVKWLRVLGIGLFLFSSCTALQTVRKAASPEEALKKRVTEYWRLNQEKKWDEARLFVDPEIRKKVETYFERREKNARFSHITHYEVKAIHVQGNRAEVVVKVNLELTHPLLGGKPYPLEQVLKESWVLRKGTWYVLINEPNLGEVLMEYQKRGRNSPAAQ